MDVLDDSLFYNNGSIIDDEDDVNNNVVPDVDNNYGVIYNRSNDANP